MEIAPAATDPVVAMEVTVTAQFEPEFTVIGTVVVPPAGRIRERKLNVPEGLEPTNTLLHVRSMK